MQTIECNKTQIYKYLFYEYKKTVQALFIIVFFRIHVYILSNITILVLLHIMSIIADY